MKYLIIKKFLNTYTNDFGRNINSLNIVNRDNKLFERIMIVYESILIQLAKENNKFKYSTTTNGARSNTFMMQLSGL